MVAWGETRPVAALRGDDPSGRALAFANASHRSFHLELATRLGCALPGARMLRSADALDWEPLALPVKAIVSPSSKLAPLAGPVIVAVGGVFTAFTAVVI